MLNIGTPKTINFLFGTNGKLMVLGVPILKHFRVILIAGYICIMHPLVGVVACITKTSLRWHSFNVKKFHDCHSNIGTTLIIN